MGRSAPSLLTIKSYQFSDLYYAEVCLSSGVGIMFQLRVGYFIIVKINLVNVLPGKHNEVFNHLNLWE